VESSKLNLCSFFELKNAKLIILLLENICTNYGFSTLFVFKLEAQVGQTDRQTGKQPAMWPIYKAHSFPRAVEF